MNETTGFAPRTIAAARSERARRAGLALGVLLWHGVSVTAAWLAAAADAWRHHRELAMLLRADARILRDIGLTRVDVRGLVAGHWWTHTSRRLLATAAARRNDAIAAAAARQACVVRIEAPPLAPAIDSVVIEGRCPRNAA